MPRSSQAGVPAEVGDKRVHGLMQRTDDAEIEAPTAAKRRRKASPSTRLRKIFERFQRVTALGDEDRASQLRRNALDLAASLVGIALASPPAASAVGASGSAGGIDASAHAKPASLVAARSEERVFWVQRVGAKSSAKIFTKACADVGDAVIEIKSVLPSLCATDADSVTLQLSAKDKDGKDRLVLLDSMDSIDKALAKASAELGRAFAPAEQLCIVVDVAAPAAAAVALSVADGKCNRAAR